MSATRPEKSPDFSSEMPLPRRLRLLIVARCAKVTSSASRISDNAETMASRTCGVRSMTGIKLGSLKGLLASAKVITTVITSVSISSEAVTLTV